MGVVVLDDFEIFEPAGQGRVGYGDRRVRSAAYMQTLSTKDPHSEEVFTWDCTAQLANRPGVVVAEILAGPLLDDGDDAWTLLEEPVIDAGELSISAKLGGCTDGVTYLLTMRYRASNGEILDRTIEFFCGNGVT